MSAKVHDNPLRYLVASRTRDDIEHLVELDAYEGNGRCSCEQFTFRLEGELKNTPDIKPSDATRCHHICEAREAFTDEIIKLIKRRQKDTGVAKQEHQQ